MLLYVWRVTNGSSFIIHTPDEERYHPLSITQIKFLRSKAVNGVVGQNLMEESFCTNNPPKIQHAKEDAHSQ